MGGLVVLSRSPGFFSAGADVEAFAAASPRRRAMTCLLAQELFRKLERTPLPSVAVIAGHALGGGLELAMACDRRVAAARDYRLGLPEVGVGLLPGSGGTQRLPRLVGVSPAVDLLATGRTVAPDEAMALGLVDALLPDPEAALAAALGWLQRRPDMT